MNHDPLVSVIIPSKNRSSMVSRAIKSVQAQTYKHFEIIVINDASTDDTPTILENLKKTDSRIIIFHNPESLGGAGARNIGLKNTHGDYVAFLDDDDEWLPNKTETQLKFLQKNPGIKAVSCWHLLKINDKIQQIQKPQKIIFQDLLWENFLGSFSFCLVKKKALKKIGLLDDKLPSAQDWDFWLRLTKECKVGIVEQYLVLYNRHNQPRISSTYISKLRGNEIILSKYDQYMDSDCVRHHKKYILYYKSLAEKNRLKKIKNLIKMSTYISKKQDWLLFFNSLGYLVLPNKLVEWLKTVYRERTMNKKTRLLGLNEYK